MTPNLKNISEKSEYDNMCEMLAGNKTSKETKSIILKDLLFDKFEIPYHTFSCTFYDGFFNDKIFHVDIETKILTTKVEFHVNTYKLINISFSKTLTSSNDSLKNIYKDLTFEIIRNKKLVESIIEYIKEIKVTVDKFKEKIKTQEEMQRNSKASSCAETQKMFVKGDIKNTTNRNYDPGGALDSRRNNLNKRQYQRYRRNQF